MNSPMQKFYEWRDIALFNSRLTHKQAVCVSTINKDGFPNGRFVELKEANNRGFSFCTFLDSTKGTEIAQNPKIAMTIWWDHVGFQVRIMGYAKALPETEATKFWQMRSRDAQIASLSSKQSQELKNETQLFEQVKVLNKTYLDCPIPKPENWGGYIVEPNQIEFLQFKENRLHIREVYTLKKKDWIKTYLQP